MQKITPCLWFDDNAQDAAKFYVSVFGKAKIGTITRYGDAGSSAAGRPKGSIMTVTFFLDGQEFMGINGGPIFKLNPSVSFMVVCKTREEVDKLWAKLSKGGEVLMELGEYPFSPRYGWTADKFGLSWQIMLSDGHYSFKHKITPSLLFVGDVCGKAEAAMKFYASIFPGGKVGDIARYPKGREPDKEGTVMHGAVFLAGQEFFAMDSAREHKFAFSEAISLMVKCKDQKEIDYFWSKLSKGGEESVCGWLKDKFGFSWQVVPASLDDMMKDQKKSEKAMEAILTMKKLNIKKIEEAVK